MLALSGCKNTFYNSEKTIKIQSKNFGKTFSVFSKFCFLSRSPVYLAPFLPPNTVFEILSGPTLYFNITFCQTVSTFDANVWLVLITSAFTIVSESCITWRQSLQSRWSGSNFVRYSYCQASKIQNNLCFFFRLLVIVTVDARKTWKLRSLRNFVNAVIMFISPLSTSFDSLFWQTFFSKNLVVERIFLAWRSTRLTFWNSRLVKKMRKKCFLHSFPCC